MKKIVITIEQENEVINLIKEFDTYRIIESKTGLKYAQIYGIAKKHNLKVTPAAKQLPVKAFIILKTLIDNPNMGTSEIAKRLEIPRQDVEKIKNQAIKIGILNKVADQ